MCTLQLSDLSSLMNKVIKVQNPDGSFGNKNRPVYTSYFLIAMVLFNSVKDPYLFFIKRALKYVLNIGDNRVESYIALKLLGDRSSLNKKEINNIITYRENMDVTGNLIYLYRTLLIKVEKFSFILFNNDMNKHELIYFLFTEILESI